MTQEKTFAKVQNHGGERVVYATGATREVSAGKGRYDLIPAEPHRRLAVHYANGAKKYTTDVTFSSGELDSELVKRCTCGHHTATRVGRTTQRESADPVTSKSCVNETRVLQNDSALTHGGGSKPTVIENEISIQPITAIREIGNAARSTTGPERYESLDSISTRKNDSSNDRGEFAGSAKVPPEGDGFTSTTVTERGRFGDSSAASATRGSAFSETISRALSKHAITCEVHRLKLTAHAGGSVRLWRTGDRNWEKGLPLSSFIDSLERHLNAFKAGERTEDHMAAILWNAYGYIETEKRIAEGRLPEELLDVPWPASTAQAREPNPGVRSEEVPVQAVTPPEPTPIIATLPAPAPIAPAPTQSHVEIIDVPDPQGGALDADQIADLREQARNMPKLIADTRKAAAKRAEAERKRLQDRSKRA